MGSKNLKAIALRGDQKMAIDDPAKFKIARKRMLDAMKDSPVLYSEFAKVGTSGNVPSSPKCYSLEKMVIDDKCADVIRLGCELHSRARG